MTTVYTPGRITAATPGGAPVTIQIADEFALS
jgi:hypothetical protein